MKNFNQKAQMKTSVATTIAIIALVLGGAVGYLTAPMNRSNALTAGSKYLR